MSGAVKYVLIRQINLLKHVTKQQEAEITSKQIPIELQLGRSVCLLEDTKLSLRGA